MVWLKRLLTEQSPVMALVLWIIITLASVLFYFIIHRCLNDRYQTTVTPLIEQSVAVFNIGPVDEEGAWALTLEGRKLTSPITGNVLKDAPFGISTFASFRGKINQTEQQLNRFNQIVEANFQSLLQESNNTYTVNERLIPLSALGIKSMTSNAFLGIPTLIAQQFIEAPSISNFSRFLSYVERGQFYQLIDNPPAPTTTTTTNTSSEITPTAISFERIKAVSQSIPDTVVLYEKIAPALTLKARQEALAELKNVWASALTVFDQNTAMNPAIIQSPEDLQIALNKSLQDSLASIVHSETSYFYLIGNYRWIDIAFFAILGVIIQANIRLIRLNTDQRKNWKGNFVILSISKMVYSPLLVVIVFFLINLISSPEISLQFTQSSLAQLGIAALLGMHPHTAYRLLRRGLKSILAEEITEPQAEPLHEKKSRLIKTPHPQTVSQLKSNILTIADNTITR